MKDTIPYTPFSTPLSGSARLTELRLKNIFSGPKRQPPALFLALMFSICLLCGNLVSCNVAETEEDPPSASLPEEAESSDRFDSVETDPTAGTASSQEWDDWETVQLRNNIISNWMLDSPYPALDDLPVDELPREAVDPLYAVRQDYWRDMLLPVAYDEAGDVTVYFVVAPDSMPDIGAEERPDLYSLDREGVLLRRGDRTGYFHLSWDINAKLGTAPLLVVDDFDGDGQTEAAFTLAWSEGTGCYCECLYILKSGGPMAVTVPDDLNWGDRMVLTAPDYANIPLKITVSPDGTRARLTSGEKEREVRLDELGVPFEGTVEVGNQVRFQYEDGRLVCQLALDFSCDTMGYLAGADFPIVYKQLPDGSGGYELGPAARLTDIL